MIELKLNENNSSNDDETAAKPPGFWRRQFQNEATFKQKRFDVIFGVLLPVICCYFDPMIFQLRVWGMGSGSFLGAYKPFAYVLSYVSIMGLLAFLLFGKKLAGANAFLSGLFFLGSIVSLIVGVLILPLSLIGLIILIGALGFTPLFSAFVFGRNAIRAYKAAAFSMNIKVLRNSVVLSAILSFCLPYIFNVQVTKGLQQMVKGDAQTVREIGSRYRYIAPLVNFEILAKETSRNRDVPAKYEALAETYRELTGEDIEEMEKRLRD